MVWKPHLLHLPLNVGGAIIARERVTEKYPQNAVDAKSFCVMSTSLFTAKTATTMIAIVPKYS